MGAAVRFWSSGILSCKLTPRALGVCAFAVIATSHSGIISAKPLACTWVKNRGPRYRFLYKLGVLFDSPTRHAGARFIEQSFSGLVDYAGRLDELDRFTGEVVLASDPDRIVLHVGNISCVHRD